MADKTVRKLSLKLRPMAPAHHIVPVHEQRCHGRWHWALAVIAFPGLVTRPALSAALPQHGGPAAIDGVRNVTTALERLSECQCRLQQRR
jgi:hypothetical protein